MADNNDARLNILLDFGKVRYPFYHTPPKACGLELDLESGELTAYVEDMAVPEPERVQNGLSVRYPIVPSTNAENIDCLAMDYAQDFQEALNGSSFTTTDSVRQGHLSEASTAFLNQWKADCMGQEDLRELLTVAEQLNGHRGIQTLAELQQLTQELLAKDGVTGYYITEMDQESMERAILQDFVEATSRGHDMPAEFAQRVIDLGGFTTNETTTKRLQQLATAKPFQLPDSGGHLRVHDVFGDGSRIDCYDDSKGLMFSQQQFPSGRTRWTVWETFSESEGGNRTLGEMFDYDSLSAAQAAVRGLRISQTAQTKNAKYAIIPKHWDGEPKQVGKALIDAGLSIERTATSSQSNSCYLYLEDGRKVRLANHPLPFHYDSPDFDYGYGGDIKKLVARITGNISDQVEEDKTMPNASRCTLETASDIRNAVFSKMLIQDLVAGIKKDGTYHCVTDPAYATVTVGVQGNQFTLHTNYQDPSEPDNDEEMRFQHENLKTIVNKVFEFINYENRLPFSQDEVFLQVFQGDYETKLAQFAREVQALAFNTLLGEQVDAALQTTDQYQCNANGSGHNLTITPSAGGYDVFMNSPYLMQVDGSFGKTITAATLPEAIAHASEFIGYADSPAFAQDVIFDSVFAHDASTAQEKMNTLLGHKPAPVSNTVQHDPIIHHVESDYSMLYAQAELPGQKHVAVNIKLDGYMGGLVHINPIDERGLPVNQKLAMPVPQLTALLEKVLAENDLCHAHNISAHVPKGATTHEPAYGFKYEVPAAPEQTVKQTARASDYMRM